MWIIPTIAHVTLQLDGKVARTIKAIGLIIDYANNKFQDSTCFWITLAYTTTSFRAFGYVPGKDNNTVWAV